MRKIALLLNILFICLISACASFTSTTYRSNENANGLSYYLPKKDLLITISYKDNKLDTILIGTTKAYPDMDKQYLLNYKYNLFGENKITLEVNEIGLLNGSNESETKSRINEIFKNLGTAAGHGSALFEGTINKEKKETEPIKKAECPDGTYSWIFSPPVSGTETHSENTCGFTIEISTLGNNQQNEARDTFNKDQEYVGLFYRQEIPYRVRVYNKEKVNVAGIVSSPTFSKTFFLPIAKTFFSDNNTKITMQEGVAKKVVEETKSEFESLTQIPASFIDAYFTAIGGIFTKLNTNATNEKSFLANEHKLRLCEAALKAGNEDLITKNCN